MKIHWEKIEPSIYESKIGVVHFVADGTWQAEYKGSSLIESFKTHRKAQLAVVHVHKFKDYEKLETG